MVARIRAKETHKSTGRRPVVALIQSARDTAKVCVIIFCACIYCTKYVTSNCLASWECLCHGKGLCVGVLDNTIEIGEGMLSHSSCKHSVLQELQSGSIVAMPIYTNKLACLLCEIRGLSNGVTRCNV